MSKYRMVVVFVVAVLATGVLLHAQDAPPADPKQTAKPAQWEFAVLYKAYEAKFKPLWLESRQAWWEANIIGSDEAFQRKQRADNALIELHGDPAVFARLKALREGGQITDRVEKRLLEVMYRKFLTKQGDPDLHKRIVALESEVQQAFNTHRSMVDGKQLTENDVRAILAETHDSTQAEKAWKGYMAVGARIDGQLRELVGLRNELARELGFDNYYTLKLTEQEFEPAEFFALLDELEALTRKPFAELKQQIDKAMAARFGIKPAQLRPWHYGDLFFQEAPATQDVDLDKLFADVDMIALARTYYASMGMPVEDILARSDLYEKPGKSPHAWCTDMDRAGDIRVLANIRPNVQWMDTLLHELGHGVYDKYLEADQPFILHKAAHGLTTEGVALMFGAMAKSEDWLVKVLKVDPEQAAQTARAARETIRTEKIVFSRWAQVMIRFEHGMYTNPAQDLGKLWSDLRNRYQLLNPPDDASRPDYGAKMHITGAPVYYHNYLFGDVFASQLQYYIGRKVMRIDDPRQTCFFGHKEVGDYLRRSVFGPGKLYSWNELTKHAMDEPLTARYFVAHFVE